MDAGISAIAWSPDQEAVVVVTALGSLLCLTKDFDVLSESSLATEGFGEAAPVNVGWGKAETQFRGQAAKTEKVGSCILTLIPLLPCALSLTEYAFALILCK